jgi:hypothetical protein
MLAQYQSTSQQFKQTTAALERVQGILNAALGGGVEYGDLGQIRDHSLARQCHQKPAYRGMTSEMLAMVRSSCALYCYFFFFLCESGKTSSF